MAGWPLGINQHASPHFCTLPSIDPAKSLPPNLPRLQSAPTGGRLPVADFRAVLIREVRALCSHPGAVSVPAGFVDFPKGDGSELDSVLRRSADY